MSPAVNLGTVRRTPPKLLHLLPNNIFVISPVNQHIHFAVLATVEQNSPLHSRVEEDRPRLRNQFGLGPIATLKEQLLSFLRNRHHLPWGCFIRPDIVRERARIGLAGCRVFVVAEHLSGDNLPLPIAASTYRSRDSAPSGSVHIQFRSHRGRS